MPTCAILEDEAVMLESLAIALQASGVQVRQQSQDPESFMREVHRAGAEVAIIDLRIDDARERPDEAGIEVLEELRRSIPQLKTVVLSSSRNPETVDRCFAAGASAYLFKHHTRPAELVRAVQAVAAGDRLFPATVLTAARSTPAASRPSILDQLSARESEVLRFVSGGADNLKISAFLGITERTVKAHLASLYRKLSCDNRTQLALKARELGVTPPRDS